MHVSIDIVAEELAREGLEVRVLSREERRGIAGAVPGHDDGGQGVLCVADARSLPLTADAGDTNVRLARNLMLVAGPGAEVLEADVANLAVVFTTLDANEVLSRVRAALLALSNWDSRMLEAIASRQGVDAVLAIAAERLENPIALFDSKQALSSFAGSFSKDAEGTIWEDVLRNRYAPIEFYSHDEQLQIERMARRRWPFSLRPARDPGREYLSAVIHVDGQAIGTIGMVDVNAPFTPGQVALVDLVADRLQMAMALRLGNGPGENDTAYLLRSILNGNKADKGLVAYHLSKLGWGVDAGFELLVCSCPEGGDAIANAGRLERVARRLGRALCILYENRVVALAPTGDMGQNAQSEALLMGLEMRAALSEPFDDVADARVAYEQCVLALEVLGEEAPGTAARFSQVFERVLPHAMSPALDRHALCDGTVLALATQGFKGDVGRGRALVRELYAYLMNGCNAHLTARQLFMHRNTLVYHIEQLEGLLGCKLDELPSSRRLFLMVSCLVAAGENR